VRFQHSINALASVRASAAFLVIVLRQTGGAIVIRDPAPAETPSSRLTRGFPLHFLESRGGLLRIVDPESRAVSLDSGFARFTRAPE
jgi:hypothetical protein